VEEIVAAPVKKTENTTAGSVALTTQHPLSANLALLRQEAAVDLSA
jgi:hypothetical protein